jgi:hypothetical protein
VKFSLLVAALVVCSTVRADAQGSPTLQGTPPSFDPSRLDPSVSIVISGGHWQVGTERGNFRLVLLRSWDRPGGRMVVQWLQAQPAAKRVILHSSRDIEGIDDRWVLDIPRLELRRGVWVAAVVATTDSGRIRRTWRFALDMPGKVRELGGP